MQFTVPDNGGEGLRDLLKVIVVVAVMVLVVLAGAVTNRQEAAADGKRVEVLHAGSLFNTMEDLGRVFTSTTGYSIVAEGHGSVKASNMIIDGQRSPDVFISASTSVMDSLVEQGKVDWWIRFFTDELVIAYTGEGPFSSTLDRARDGDLPWYHVLSKDGFRFGRTDPELDPKGYRCIMMASLAQEHYGVPSLRQEVLGGDRNPEQVLPEEILTVHLELGDLDAIIAYKHEAVERGLRYIELPPEINLGSRTHVGNYETAFYLTEDGEKRSGSLIEFALAIPKEADDPVGAVRLCEFLLSTKANTILVDHGLVPLVDVDFEGDTDKVPDTLRGHLP